MKQETDHKWVFMLDELLDVKRYTGNDPEAIRALLSGIGANLAEMAHIGIPVPPGFIVTPEACNAYYESGAELPEGMWDQVLANMEVLGEKLGRTFGDDSNPLLVSVRAGARVSMPGMMDTILNLGLTPAGVETMGKKFGDMRFAWDLYRRLVQMYGKVVLDVPGELFEEIIDEIRKEDGAETDGGISADGWKKCADLFKKLVEDHTGDPWPEAPFDQLKLGIEAAFKSWNAKRAVDYRNKFGYPHNWGTAVRVQTMVYGCFADGQSATGVMYTRNPSTGEKQIYGEYLLNARAEDIVFGTRVALDIYELEQKLPEAFNALVKSAEILEQHYRDMQDIEFTIEAGNLWILQSRNAKRSTPAAFRIAVDLVEEGIINEEEALDIDRVSPDAIEKHPRPGLDRMQKQTAIEQGVLLAKGLGVSPGTAAGQVAFDSDTAHFLAGKGKSVILVRPIFTCEDIHGLLSSSGIVALHEGNTSSHDVVKARLLGIPCVTGCSEIEFGLFHMRVNDRVINEGDWLTIDGYSGHVFAGKLELKQRGMDNPYLSKILLWADEFRKLEIWANADNVDQLRQARKFGAQGIVIRTEHIFMGERSKIFRQYILAETEETRHQKLAELQALQHQDFRQIFEIGDGLPIEIRLLALPLHGFLPARSELLVENTRAKARGETSNELHQQLLDTVTEMAEFNPLLSLRGSRVELVMPGVYQMQVRAIFNAACEAKSRGIAVFPRIMLPMITHVNELKLLRETLESTAQQILDENQCKLEFKFGCTIEIPRAALTAAEISQEVDFYSFDMNSLTQMTFGVSLDDAERHFLLPYVEKGILPMNPFQSIDKEGVGLLISMAVEGAHRTERSLEIGVFGEQAGDPSSIEMFHEMGLDYISTEPLRVPAARLAAAQAALRSKGRTPK